MIWKCKWVEIGPIPVHLVQLCPLYILTRPARFGCRLILHWSVLYRSNDSNFSNASNDLFILSFQILETDATLHHTTNSDPSQWTIHPFEISFQVLYSVTIARRSPRVAAACRGCIAVLLLCTNIICMKYTTVIQSDWLSFSSFVTYNLHSSD